MLSYPCCARWKARTSPSVSKLSTCLSSKLVLQNQCNVQVEVFRVMRVSLHISHFLALFPSCVNYTTSCPTFSSATKHRNEFASNQVDMKIVTPLSVLQQPRSFMIILLFTLVFAPPCLVISFTQISRSPSQHRIGTSKSSNWKNKPANIPKQSTKITWPTPHAPPSTTLPRPWPPWSAASTLAPADISCSTTAAWPFVAAKCSAVQPRRRRGLLWQRGEKRHSNEMFPWVVGQNCCWVIKRRSAKLILLAASTAKKTRAAIAEPNKFLIYHF